MNTARLLRGLRAVKAARVWLRQESDAAPSVCSGRLARHYALALGQLDRALMDSVEEIMATTEGGSLVRVGVLRRRIGEVLAYCDRRAREPVPLVEAAQGERWAMRRARTELSVLLSPALR